MNTPESVIVPVNEIQSALGNNIPKDPSSPKHAFEEILQGTNLQIDQSTQNPVIDGDRLHVGSVNYNDFLKMFSNSIDTKTRVEILENKSKSSVISKQFDITELIRSLESDWAHLEDVVKMDNKPSMSDLIKLQAQMYKVSESLGVVTKVVDEITGGVKTVLNTNV